MISSTAIADLLAHVLDVSERFAEAADRRQATLDHLLKRLGARAAHWAWGYGDAVASRVQPVAIVTSGYEPAELGVISQMGLDSEIDKSLRVPILRKLNGAPQSVDLRRHIFEDDAWQTAKMRGYLLTIQADEWLHAVRYESDNVWSNMFFIRSVEEPPFEPEQAALLDVCIGAIPWLRAARSAEPARDSIVKLSDRQRTVMLLLLDGQSRKKIASILSISEETVGDHIKQIYQSFKVNSAGELSAIFLRNR